MQRPRIAVGPPDRAAFAPEAVVEGGGAVVPWDEAEAAVWMSVDDVDGLRRALAGAPAVRWVQLPWAGVEDFAAAGLLGDGRTWTCGKGVYAEEVAEHALALVLACLRHLPDRARSTAWGRRDLGRSLLGRPVCVLGGGGITASLVRLLAPFGCDVTVVRRSGEQLPGAARTLPVSQLAYALPDAGVLVLALALTPATTGIVGAAELAALPPGAIVVNVARGAHVDTAALVDSLRAGHLGGAGLDVTDPEPLPDGHPLFSMANVVVTCHSANTPEMAAPVLFRRIRDNVARFAAGQELIGLVDPAAGY